MRSLVWTWIVGLVVGALARRIIPGRDPGGMLVTMLLGVAGALAARYIGMRLGLYAPGQSAGFFLSIGGAVLLLALYGLVKHRHAV